MYKDKKDPNGFAPGWLLKQVERANKEFDALPDWMKTFLERERSK